MKASPTTSSRCYQECVTKSEQIQPGRQQLLKLQRNVIDLCFAYWLLHFPRYTFLYWCCHSPYAISSNTFSFPSHGLSIGRVATTVWHPSWDTPGSAAKAGSYILKRFSRGSPLTPWLGELYKRLFNIKIFPFFYVVFKIKPLGLLISLMLLLWGLHKMILKEKFLKDSSISNIGNQSDFVALDISGNFDITEVKGKRFYMTVWTDAYF